VDRAAAPRPQIDATPLETAGRGTPTQGGAMKLFVIESGEDAAVIAAEDSDGAWAMFWGISGVTEGGAKLTQFSAIPDRPGLLFVGKRRPRNEATTAPNPSGGAA
jgi:hypothetical protein